jgi:hypothetical protein
MSGISTSIRIAGLAPVGRDHDLGLRSQDRERDPLVLDRIFDEQHALRPRRRALRNRRLGYDAGFTLGEPRGEPERAATSRSILDADLAAHLLDQPLADRQAQPGATGSPRGGRRGARLECREEAPV